MFSFKQGNFSPKEILLERPIYKYVDISSKSPMSSLIYKTYITETKCLGVETSQGRHLHSFSETDKLSFKILAPTYSV